MAWPRDSALRRRLSSWHFSVFPTVSTALALSSGVVAADHACGHPSPQHDRLGSADQKGSSPALARI